MAIQIKIKRKSKAPSQAKIIFLFAFGALIVWMTWELAQENTELATNGYETKITIQTVDHIERNGRRKKRDTYDEYYTVTYEVNGEIKETDFMQPRSHDEEPDFAVGEILPAVVDDLKNPSIVKAPQTKESLGKAVPLLKGLGGIFAALFVIQGIRMFRHKSEKD